VKADPVTGVSRVVRDSGQGEHKGENMESRRGERYKRVTARLLLGVVGLLPLVIGTHPRSFWWRVINSFLPCKVDMRRRHKQEESYYDSCGNPSENIYYVLVACP
jgi:hypothetical protein